MGRHRREHQTLRFKADSPTGCRGKRGVRRFIAQFFRPVRRRVSQVELGIAGQVQALVTLAEQLVSLWGLGPQAPGVFAAVLETFIAHEPQRLEGLGLLQRALPLLVVVKFPQFQVARIVAQHGAEQRLLGGAIELRRDRRVPKGKVTHQ